jgi:hypothetical protein
MITRKRKINQIPSTSVLSTNSKILVIHEGSTATISALDIISGISVISADHLSDFNNPHQVTKTQVGLSNVENTADLDKPISTSTQIALDSKQDTLVSGVNIKTLNGVPLLGAGDVAVNFPVTTVNTKTGNVVLDSTDIPEGANLYYTNARVESVGDSRYVSLAGSYGNPSWLTSIDWSKINSKPSTLLGYNILDPVILATGNYINPSWIASIDFSKLTSVPLFATQLDELSDVQIISPKNSQVIMYDGTTWRNADNLAETKLLSLTDVDLTTPTNSDVLQYNGTKWVNVPASSVGATSISGLDDVTLSPLSSGQALVYNGTAWVNQNAEEVLNSTLLTNQAVGGISSGTSYPAGTPLETIVRNILVTYLPPLFSTLRAKNGGTTLSTSTYEIGATFTVTNVSVSVTADNPNGDPPTNVSVSVSGADTGSGTIASGLTVVVGANSTLTVTTGNYTRATNGSVTFTMTGLDANSNNVTISQAYSFQSYNYFGGDSTVVVDDATATAVRDVIKNQRKAFDTNRAWSTTGTIQTNDGANFSYIMYPASYGDLSNVLLGATPVLGAFTKIGDFNILTENGNVSVSYRVYKSNATGAFSNGASLTIS